MNEKKCAENPVPSQEWSTAAGSWPSQSVWSILFIVLSHRCPFTNGTKFFRLRNAT
jgi:hypothetical protein